MRFDTDHLKELCRKRHIRLHDLLAQSGVSRTAYYSLARKESVLPKSVCRIADHLGVSPSRFLVDTSEQVLRLQELQKRAELICRRNPECDRDVVLRTLMNLELPPVERLRKALIRGRKPHLH